MNYTLINAINRLKIIFDKETKDRNILDIEDALSYENVKDVYNKILEISYNDYEDFSSLISLLTIEYFNIICNDMKNNNIVSKKQVKVLLHIINSSKNDYIRYLYLEELNDLLVIISTIIEEYSFDCEFELDEYPYSYIEDLLKDSNVLSIYKEYHPDFELEMNKLNEYIESNKTYEMISKLKIKDVYSFIYIFSVLKQNIEDKYDLISMVMSKLWEIYGRNERLYKKIVYYLCGYFYVKNKNKISSDPNIQKFLVAIENSDEDASVLRFPPLLPGGKT